MNRPLAFLTLFASSATLLCCALPVLLVSLGFGAVMAGLASNIPGLIWISENKFGVFVFAGISMGINAIFLWYQRDAPCPVDPVSGRACKSGRRFSLVVLGVSFLIYVIGGLFGFVAPKLIF